MIDAGRAGRDGVGSAKVSVRQAVLLVLALASGAASALSAKSLIWFALPPANTKMAEPIGWVISPCWNSPSCIGARK